MVAAAMGQPITVTEKSGGRDDILSGPHHHDADRALESFLRVLLPHALPVRGIFEAFA